MSTDRPVRRLALSAVLGAVLLIEAPATHAQGVAGPAAYPLKTVRVIVGFAPGGGVDILARAVSIKLSETLGRPFVVENRSGAGGTTGYAHVTKASPDGYTLLAISGSYAMSAALYQNLPYDPIREFTPSP